MRKTLGAAATGGLLLALSGTAALAQATDAPAHHEAVALARAAQNPVANMISLPFQNDMNFGYGPNDHIQNVLNIQPVIPTSPECQLEPDNPHHPAGDLAARHDAGRGHHLRAGCHADRGFLWPARPEHIIWGAGAVMQAPTTTDRALGRSVWGGGPTFVALTMDGPWVIGGLVNNISSAGGERQRRARNGFAAAPRPA